MTFLRIILAFVLAWYLVKLLARWIAGPGRGVPGGGGERKRNDYAELTDQEIEDAEYEDLERE